MNPPKLTSPGISKKNFEMVMDSPEIIAIIGPRRCGKKTIMNAARSPYFTTNNCLRCLILLGNIRYYSAHPVLPESYQLMDEMSVEGVTVKFLPHGGVHS